MQIHKVPMATHHQDDGLSIKVMECFRKKPRVGLKIT